MIGTIQPLLKFTSMRVLDWIFPGQVHLTDADVAHIAEAWPLLEQLRIKSLSRDYVSPATLSSVFVAARQCPRLERLTLPVNVSRLPNMAGEPFYHTEDSEFRHEHIKVIELGTCFVDATRLAAIASTFAQAFPRLRSIQLDLPIAEEDIVDDSDVGYRTFGGRLCTAIQTLRQAKESGRIASWTDEGTLKILVRYFEASWDTDRRGEYNSCDEVLSYL
ncbi:hypothetical protein CONPUDRAFT_148280 [Coniophora puteana RWD-64-598 SS2]|uniref:F-box domain-containing protein n=1 Tax=Coniophora puteana (strain RWD-64-598) TaxID=741705 RepID=A0A5M3N4F1_CONPW|nr:uncharacterized protein CONPUDRAFT_148280 [Coniophora puteana RWD-64-598 SS2]EIW86176.1 hypothetical protein CONPUDRAFT_148280 [Coniophora puteana RWD-64-598 SS2]